MSTNSSNQHEAVRSTTSNWPDQVGRYSDLTTQRWVQATGRRITWEEHPWIAAPVGDETVIGGNFFHRFAKRHGLEVVEDGAPRGLLDSFAALNGPAFRTEEVSPAIAGFYERTSDYAFDVWSQWSAPFRPLGGLLSTIFSRRLQQLNVPLSPLETSLGVTSNVVKLVSGTGSAVISAWIRESIATGTTIYAGSYSSDRVPGFDGPCVKVAFPLPNGYALIVMKPQSNPDGSFTIRSEGRGFGDPGFYLYVESSPGEGWARYVASMKESIHVFLDDRSVLRADHDLRIWGRRFLRLHYRMTPRGQ